WTEWVSTAGQVGAEAVPAPPATGGGTLTTEPVVLCERGPAGWALTSLYGLALGSAAGDDRDVVVCSPDGRPAVTLRHARPGAASVVAVHVVDGTEGAGREVGRFEEVRASVLGGFRLVGAGTVLGSLDAVSTDRRQLALLDLDGRLLARLTGDGPR